MLLIDDSHHHSYCLLSLSCVDVNEMVSKNERRSTDLNTKSKLCSDTSRHLPRMMTTISPSRTNSTGWIFHNENYEVI
ncbi:hypothetical protein [Halopiger xanaduensis]